MKIKHINLHRNPDESQFFCNSVKRNKTRILQTKFFKHRNSIPKRRVKTKIRGIYHNLIYMLNFHILISYKSNP